MLLFVSLRCSPKLLTVHVFNLSRFEGVRQNLTPLPNGRQLTESMGLENGRQMSILEMDTVGCGQQGHRTNRSLDQYNPSTLSRGSVSRGNPPCPRFTMTTQVLITSLCYLSLSLSCLFSEEKVQLYSHCYGLILISDLKLILQ